MLRGVEESEIQPVLIRSANGGDLEAILRIYNEGIEDRVATLETDPKAASDITEWWAGHGEPYAVLVAVDSGVVVGWASFNPFSHRCAHRAIADLSIYIARAKRGRRIGFALLDALIGGAHARTFHKIVLHALDENEAGKRLYRKCGFTEVGVFKEHGVIEGRYVDVVAMERLL